MPKKVPLGLLNLEQRRGTFRFVFGRNPASGVLHYVKLWVWTILSGGLDSLNHSFEYLLYSERLYLNERKMPFGWVKDYI